MRLISLCLLTLLFFSGCSQKEPNVQTNNQELMQNSEEFSDFESEFEEPVVDNDPFEGYNRAVTSFNDFMYLNLFNPISRGYAYVIPEVVRNGIDNMFENLFYPIRLTNNLLQGKFENSAEETGRFLVNSTVGLLGFFDVAKEQLDWQPHKEDFGQTLGFYGVPGGPHLVLPIFGPSNIRDTIGFAADAYLSPTTETSSLNYKIPDTTTEGVAFSMSYYLNKDSLRPNDYKNFTQDAVDLYTHLKSFYEQKREEEIKE